MNNKQIFVTAVGKKDGFGSQLLSKILAIVYCKKNNFEYIHVPLKTLDVRDQDESGKKAYQEGKGNQWVQKWENLLNIGKDFRQVHQIKYDFQVNLTDLIKEKQITMKDNYLLHNFDPTERINYYRNMYPNKKILFNVKEFPKFDKYELEDYKDIFSTLRQNSNLNRTILDKSKINIVLHVRHTRDARHRLLKNWNKNNFKNFLVSITNKLENKDIQISIISDGKMNNFPEYEFITNNLANLKNTNIKNIKMYLSTNSLEAFNIMTEANILVMHVSAFSYCAGLFNENFVIYPEFHDKPLKNWFIYNDEDFDKLDFTKKYV